MFFCPSRTRRSAWSVRQRGHNWSLIIMRKTCCAGRSFNTRLKPEQASTLARGKMLETVIAVFARESTQLISLGPDDCLGMQLKSVTIPNSQRFTRLMLQNIYEDRSTCHVEIECSVISFEIRKHSNCHYSRLWLVVPCVVWTDADHFVSLRCSLSPSSCTSFALQTS